ncbi:EF-P beta-lysylation protein EpmB [Denitratimonas tolerans]|uniref:L-lysine 2,3-aminomutase n=1 Tax=Denitratimonas tolerans TaxID=1338420 RepID=A0AAW9R309_9GAMM|nr:EF-P beta-lysylation protein EpmB [Chiayiivirga sp.]
MIPATPRAAQPSDWRRQYRDAITRPHELLALLGLTHLADRVPADAAGFPLRVPRAFAARMRHGDPDDPLLRQVLPLDEETRCAPGFGIDAVGDLAARETRGLLHKYEGRALLIATGSCAVNCRYCFRRHFPYAEETAAANGWREAVAHLLASPDIHEVLLSGGDPLALSTAKLAELTAALRAAPHLKRLRIHSRLPVVLPARVDDALLDWLAALPWPVVMVIHANHAQEIDPSVAAACAALASRPVRLYNQSVLLRGVNDSVDALADLSERLFEIGVQPYYLHQLDRVAGTAHFEVPESRAVALYEDLRARLPGYLLPRLVREVQGAPAKLPLFGTS